MAIRFAFTALVVGAAHEGFELTLPLDGAESRRRRKLFAGYYRVRQFVYHYNAQDKLEEVEDDMTGATEIPTVGSIVNRLGKEWKVIHVIAPVSSRGTIPVVRVFLSDRIKQTTFAVKHLPK